MVYIILLSCFLSVAVSVPVPELNCQSDYVEIVFNKDDFNVFNGKWLMYFAQADSKDINCMLNSSNINPGVNNDRNVSLNTKYTKCGISFGNWTESSVVYYGKVYLKESTPDKVIERNIYLFEFRCIFNQTTRTVLRAESHVQGTRYIEGSSKFRPNFALYTNDNFNQKNLNNRVALGSKMFFQISITSHSKHAQINAANCYATDIQNKTRHYLIRDSCPDKNDGTVKLLNSISNPHTFRWKNDAFKFKGESSYFYVTCEVWVCLKYESFYSQCHRCATRKKRQISLDNENNSPTEVKIKSSLIKIDYRTGQENNTDDKGKPKSMFGKSRDAIIIGLLVAVVLIIVVAAILHVKYRRSEKMLSTGIITEMSDIGADNEAMDIM